MKQHLKIDERLHLKPDKFGDWVQVCTLTDGGLLIALQDSEGYADPDNQIMLDPAQEILLRAFLSADRQEAASILADRMQEYWQENMVSGAMRTFVLMCVTFWIGFGLGWLFL